MVKHIKEREEIVRVKKKNLSGIRASPLSEKLLCTCRASLALWMTEHSRATLDICRHWQVKKQQTQSASHRTPPHHTEPQHPQSNDSSAGTKTFVKELKKQKKQKDKSVPQG